jgi:hypothetical protein
MFRKMSSAVLVTALVGCGASAASAPAMRAQSSGPAAEVATLANDAVIESGEAPTTAPMAVIDPSTLPVAPWADAPLATREVPRPLMSAWERAANRDWCAPIAPRSFGAASGARARTSELEGGWAVEFDQRGMPGVARDGATCATCGRGVFGIAGTGMTPEELIDVDSDAAAPAASFRDGSHAELEVSDEQVAAATITVSGQGCVYQVWSFLGQQHVEELVRELRFVELPQSRGALAAR